ncbi:MAG: hypothetical protein CIT03_02485 [Methanobacterium sp.]|nr:MAG: hypothetical protein CIT03_02485 [Methanobacterium sp.]
MEQPLVTKIVAFYWNHLKLSNVILSFFIVFIIKFVLETYYSPGDLNTLISANKDNIYLIVATISGTLLGFIITSISVIAAFFDSKKLELIREYGMVNDLFNIFFSTIKFLAITTLIAILGIISNWTILIFYLIIFNVIVSSFLIACCIWALETIIKGLGN